MQGISRHQSVYQNIVSLEDMFQKAYKNYAYRLLELEMTIDEVGLSIGRTKKQDISELIQLYMIGVEVLQSTGDSRFGYFRTKLHDLMLKKQVVKQLKFTAPEEILKKQRIIRQNKRKEYETKLATREQQETRQADSIINTAATTMQNYKQSMQNTLKKQQNQIKQRLNSRNKRPQTAGSSIPKSMLPKKQQLNGNSPPSEYYSPPPLPKSKREAFGLEVKSIPMQSSPQQKINKISKPPIPIEKREIRSPQDGI